jgi:hypothetical protein
MSNNGEADDDDEEDVRNDIIMEHLQQQFRLYLFDRMPSDLFAEQNLCETAEERTMLRCLAMLLPTSFYLTRRDIMATLLYVYYSLVLNEQPTDYMDSRLLYEISPFHFQSMLQLYWDLTVGERWVDDGGGGRLDMASLVRQVFLFCRSVPDAPEEVTL